MSSLKTMNISQIKGISQLRTEANLPGAQDTEAMANRTIALNWLMRLDGRNDPGHPMHNLYTGLWQEFLKIQHEALNSKQ
tara:strand:- start:249 stop:488 length:240 start_codon:yes stop_codon:yes gene_type:complete